MKVFSFGGGLGNQIFEYAFYSYMKHKYPNHRMFGHYNAKRLGEHYGLEIDKWFDVELPKSTWYSTTVVAFSFLMKHLFGINRFIDSSQRECKNENAKALLAFKYTNVYIPQSTNWLTWKIEESQLSEQNINVLEEIKNSNSWFIHVRRGDFLSEKYKKDYEGCCPLSYYEKAISDVLKNTNDPVFFCFSVEIEWAKENLPKVNINFVDWNVGKKSPIDMYLMSQCKGAIIANSTFSYWGAVLGNPKKQVYYPEKWVANADMLPHIFYESWKKY